ncbi:hypothetical protein D3C78_993070 [compost metagenome]
MRFLQGSSRSFGIVLLVVISQSEVAMYHRISVIQSTGLLPIAGSILMALLVIKQIAQIVAGLGVLRIKRNGILQHLKLK